MQNITMTPRSPNFENLLFTPSRELNFLLIGCIVNLFRASNLLEIQLED